METNLEGNEEIQKALKDFEVEDAPLQAKQVVLSSTSAEMPRMVRLVIKASGGLVKDQKQAEYILLTITIILFALSLYLFLS